MEITRSAATVGRPRGGDPTKRQVILDAAITTFLREGYERAGVDTIAEAAGVAKQTVYNHFGAKENLFLAAVDHERCRSTPGSAPETTTPEVVDTDAAGAESELIAIARQMLAALLDERTSALRRLVISEVGRHPSLRPACDEGELAQLVGYLTETLRRQIRRGELEIPDPGTAARQFVALLVQQGLSSSTYGTKELADDQSDTICRETAELFLRAYRTEPA